MSDTGISEPLTRADVVKGFIGDMARPFAIYVTSASAAITPVVLAVRIDVMKIDLTGAGIFIGAIFAGLGALYGAKAWENAKIGAQNAAAQAGGGGGS